MAGSHDVYIFESDCGYRVRPAVTMFRGSTPGHPVQVRFRNLVARPVWLVFPAGFLAHPIVKRPKDLTPPHGTPDSALVPAGEGVTITLHTGLNGRYEYQALVLSGTQVVAAAGESGPSMIVDP